MSITQIHPAYAEYLERWSLLRDCYSGEDAIKEAGITYLPPTPGQVLDGMGAVGANAGEAAYQAYKARAVFPDFFSVGIETLIGILNAKETKIELPAELDYLRNKAMLNGEKLSSVIRKIHEQQLIIGRVGLLADLPAVVSTNPEQYIELYNAEKILNWDDGAFNDGFFKLNLVVLDESGYERHDKFNWKKVNRYRVLTLGGIAENEALGSYQCGTTTVNGDLDTVTLSTPVIRGEPLQEIPFIFVGAKDLSSAPDKPPLLGLAQLCMQIYRAEADYRYTLFMQGQDTLVVVGGIRQSLSELPNMASATNALRVGAGARIDVEIGGDAKYVGIGATGLPEQRTALENDRNQAAVRTGQLLAPGKMSMESGEALKTRVAAQTATLTSVAIAAAAGLEQLLRIMAAWQGADPDEVKVIPNLDFTNVAIAGQDLVQLLTAKNLGMPMSYATIHAIMVDRGLTKNTFEQEMALIEKDPKRLTEIAAMLAAPPQANNPTLSGGGPSKKPGDAPG